MVLDRELAGKRVKRRADDTAFFAEREEILEALIHMRERRFVLYVRAFARDKLRRMYHENGRWKFCATCRPQYVRKITLRRFLKNAQPAKTSEETGAHDGHRHFQYVFAHYMRLNKFIGKIRTALSSGESARLFPRDARGDGRV